MEEGETGGRTAIFRKIELHPRNTFQDAAADTCLLTLVCLPPGRHFPLYEKGKMRSETAEKRT